MPINVIHKRGHDYNSTIDHTGALSESKISFDTLAGHDHDGTDSKIIPTLKETKQAVSTWTSSDGITSNTYVDITNATVTITGLDASKTYSLVAIGTLNSITSSSGTNDNKAQILIDGTASGEGGIRVPNSTVILPLSLSGMKLNVTGSTSYTAKLQGKIDSGIFTTNAMAITNTIILLAIEE